MASEMISRVLRCWIQFKSRCAPSTREFWLLKLLLRHEELIEWTGAHLDLNWIQHRKTREIISLAISHLRPGDGNGAVALLGKVEDDESRSLITEVLAEDRPLPNPEQQVR